MLTATAPHDGAPAGRGKGGPRAGFPWWDTNTQVPRPAPPRARRQCRAGRASAEVEELPPALHAAYPGHEQLEIRIALDEIEILELTISTGAAA